MNGYDVTFTGGAFFFFIPYMLLYLVTVNEILKEKEKKLRQGVNVMGLTNTSYWVSWVLTSILLNIFVTLLLILAGQVSGFDFFLKTSLPILIVFFVSIGFALQVIVFPPTEKE